MFRSILIVGLISLSTAGHAYGSSGCQTPTLDFGINQDIGSKYDYDYTPNGHSKDISFSISLSIPLGKNVQRQCDATIAKIRAEEHKVTAEAWEKEGRARDANADAEAQELDNYEQKISICSDFTVDTAPQSIRHFCGDLIE